MDKSPLPNENKIRPGDDHLSTENSLADKDKLIKTAACTEKKNPHELATNTHNIVEPEHDKASTIEDEQWLELTQDWQAQPTKKTDVTALLKQTKRRTQGAKLCYALNIMGTLALMLVFLYGVYDNQLGDPVNTYIGVGTLLSVILIYFETKIRLQTWRQLCDSPEKAIENAISACQSSVKYMAMTKISFLPFLPLVNWFIYQVGQQQEKDVIDAYLMANGCMLLMYVVVDYLHRKRKKQYQQLLKSLPE
ncbi:hypothetical protein AADZ84_13020 [Colwelliaceae bacterium MEBiC 14330]